MSLTAISLLAAFGTGVLSFLSPCVLPLMPGYLAYLAGVNKGMNTEKTPERSTLRWKVSWHALWFVAGSIVVLTFLGGIAALFGAALHTYQLELERVGGLILIVLGVALTGLIPIPWVSKDHRFQLATLQPGQSVWWRSGVIGLAFGASWSACAGPLLGAILVLTAVGSRLAVQGMSLMFIFAVGQGIPLLLVALLVDRAGPLLRRIHRYTAILSYIGAATLILMGMLLILFPSVTG